MNELDQTTGTRHAFMVFRFLIKLSVLAMTKEWWGLQHCRLQRHRNQIGVCFFSSGPLRTVTEVWELGVHIFVISDVIQPPQLRHG